jgi:hypothetical protein
VCRCNPWWLTARKGERKPKKKKNQEISLWGLHTHYFPSFHYERAHYYTGSLGKLPNSHPEPIQYSELCSFPGIAKSK